MVFGLFFELCDQSGLETIVGREADSVILVDSGALKGHQIVRVDGLWCASTNYRHTPL